MEFEINFDSFSDNIKEYNPKDVFLYMEKTSKKYKILSHNTTKSNVDCTGAFYESDIVDKTHLVYAVYSTGDEAMNYSNTQIEFIEVFLTENKANRCKEQISANYALFNYLSNNLTLDKNLLNSLSKNVLNLPIDKNEIINTFKLQNVYFQNERDEVKKLRSPWHGHFNSLDFVESDTFNHSVKKNLNFKI